MLRFFLQQRLQAADFLLICLGLLLQLLLLPSLLVDGVREFWISQKPVQVDGTGREMVE